jgi:hypothetical protein
VIVISGPSYRDYEHKKDVGTTRRRAEPMTPTATIAAKTVVRAKSAAARRRGKC